jgi:hypothetical protein
LTPLVAPLRLLVALISLALPHKRSKNAVEGLCDALKPLRQGKQRISRVLTQARLIP